MGLSELINTDSTGFCFYEHFCLAGTGDTAIAGMAGYSLKSGVSPSASVRTLQRVLERRGWHEEQINQAREAFSAIANACEGAPSDAWQIEWVAADANGRGKGF